MASGLHNYWKRKREKTSTFIFLQCPGGLQPFCRPHFSYLHLLLSSSNPSPLTSFIFGRPFSCISCPRRFLSSYLSQPPNPFHFSLLPQFILAASYFYHSISPFLPLSLSFLIPRFYLLFILFSLLSESPISPLHISPSIFAIPLCVELSMITHRNVPSGTCDLRVYNSTFGFSIVFAEV